IAGVPLWEKIKAPALVIRGERSTRFGPEVLAEIRARAPQVQMAEVPASDHHITLDNPQGFVEAVRRFLSEKAGSVIRCTVRCDSSLRKFSLAPAVVTVKLVTAKLITSNAS